KFEPATDGKEIILAQFDSDRYRYVQAPTLASARTPATEFQRARLDLSLRKAGFEGGLEELESLPGTFVFDFDFEEGSNTLRDYYIWWLSETEEGGQQEILVGGRFDGEEIEADLDQLPEEDRELIADYSRRLQTVLMDSGDLAVNHTPGAAPGEQTIQSAYFFMTKNPELFAPLTEEVRQQLVTMARQEGRISDEMLVLEKASLSDDIKDKVMSELLRERLGILSRQKSYLKQTLESFRSSPAYKESAEIKRLCEDLDRMHGMTESKIREMLDTLFGYSGEGNVPVDETKLFFRTYLEPAESRVSTYFSDFRKLPAKRKFPTSTQQAAERRGIVQEYQSMYQYLLSLEETYWWVEDLIAQCATLRDGIKQRLGITGRMQADIIAAFGDLDEKHDAKMIELGSRVSVLAEHTDDFTFTITDKQANPGRTYRLHAKAAYLNDLIGDSPIRNIIIEYFTDILSSQDFSHHELNSKLGEIIALDLDPTKPSFDLQELGDYLWESQILRSRGYSEYRIKEQMGSPSLNVQDMLKTIERICRVPDDSEKSLSLNDTVLALIRALYQQQLVHNMAAPRGNKLQLATIYMELQKIAEAVSPQEVAGGDRSFGLEVFRLLGRLPETPAQADSQLSHGLLSALTKSHSMAFAKARMDAETDPTKKHEIAARAARFSSRSTQVVISPQTWAAIAAEGSKKATVYDKETLKALLDPDDLPGQIDCKEDGSLECQRYYLVDWKKVPDPSDPTKTILTPIAIPVSAAVRLQTQPHELAAALSFTGEQKRAMVRVLDAFNPVLSEKLGTDATDFFFRFLENESTPDQATADKFIYLCAALITIEGSWDDIIASGSGPEGLTEKPEAALTEAVEEIRTKLGYSEPLGEEYFSGVFREHKIADVIDHGGAIINLLLAGRAPSAGFLRLVQQGILTDAIGPATLDGIIQTSSKGKFYFSGGLSISGFPKIVLDRLMDDDTSPLSARDIELLRMVQRQGGLFTEAEIEELKELVKTLEKLHTEIDRVVEDGSLPWLKVGSKAAIKTIYRAIARQLDYNKRQKLGLETKEITKLRTLRDLMTKHKFMVRGETFNEAQGRDGSVPIEAITEQMERSGASAEEIKAAIEAYRACLPIFRRLHHQARKMASAIIPEVPTPEGITDLSGMASVLWHGAKEGATNLISPPRMESFQIAGLPPMQFAALKAFLHKEKYAELQHNVLLLATLKSLVKSETEYSQITEAEIKEGIRALFGYSEKEQAKATPEELATIDDEVLAKLLAVRQAGEESRIIRLQVATLKAPLEKLEAELEKRATAVIDVKATARASRKGKSATESGRQSQASAGRRLGNAQDNVSDSRSQYKAIQKTIKRLQEMATEGASDPLTFLSSLESIVDQIDQLERTKAFDAVKDEALGEELRQILGAIKAKAEGLQAGRDTYIKMEEERQDLKLDMQDGVAFFTSGQFTADDWKELKALDTERKGNLLHHNQSLVDMGLDLFDTVMNQKDPRMFGYMSGPEKPIFTILESFFSAGNSVNMYQTSTCFGEEGDRTSAKVALTKIFEALPIETETDLLATGLTFTFGHTLGGIANIPRDAVTVLGSLLDFGDTTIGSRTISGQLEVLDDPLARAQYIMFSSMAASSNGATPFTPMSSQFHYLMAFSSEESQEYLQRKIMESGGDLDQALTAEINTDDFASYKKFLIKTLMRLQRQPGVVRELLPLIKQKKSIKSVLIRTVIENCRDSFEGQGKVKLLTEDEISTMIDELWPVDSTTIDPADFIHADSEDKAFVAVLEDILKIQPSLNRLQSTEDPERDSITYLDVQMRLAMLSRQFAIDPANPPEHVYILEDVTYRPDLASSDRISNPSESWIPLYPSLESTAHEANVWITETYGPEIVADMDEAVQNFTDGEWLLVAKSLEKTSSDFFHEIGHGLHYGVFMGRSIATQLSGMVRNGVRAAIAGIFGDEREYQEYLKAFLKDLASTGVMFAGFEGMPAVFFLSLKEKLEQRNYGGFLAQMMLIITIFHTGVRGGMKLLRPVMNVGRNISSFTGNMIERVRTP
ncbi:MAG: hypothetical protein ABIE84_03265, partial [bacterium]